MDDYKVMITDLVLSLHRERVDRETARKVVMGAWKMGNLSASQHHIHQMNKFVLQEIAAWTNWRSDS